MKFRKPLLFNILLALLVASCIIILSKTQLLEHFELGSLDLSFNIRGPLPCDPRIILVEITDADIKDIGRWPWARSWHAAMTKALTGLGAKLIYFDVIFSEPSTEKEDSLFGAEIKESGRVALPFAFEGKEYDLKKAFLPIARFKEYISGTGAIDIYPDIDGSLRRVPLVLRGKGGTFDHAALSIARICADLKIDKVTERYMLLSSSQEKVKIPLVTPDTMLVNWRGKWTDTYKHYRYLDVLAAFQDKLENKKPNINIDNFKGSICLVAVTALGLYDIDSIPFEPEYPRVGLIATAIDNILNKSFIYTPPAILDNFILIILCLLVAFLISGEKPFRETVSAVCLGGLYFLTQSGFFKAGVYLHLFTPILGIGLTYATVGTYNFVRIALERKSFFNLAVTDGLTGLFNIRYFKILLETEIVTIRSDTSKRLSVVMSDVDHFKNFNDTYGHQVGDLVLKNVANAIKAGVRSSDIVARYGGEEMIVLLRGADSADALKIAEKLRRAVESAVVKDTNNTYQVTASFGVSEFRPGDDAEKIIKRADDGLYKAKALGRNRVSVATYTEFSSEKPQP